MKLEIIAELAYEPPWIVAYARALNIASCGETPDKAVQALTEAVHLFAETIYDLGTFEELLLESGYIRKGEDWILPEQAPSQQTSSSTSTGLDDRRVASLEI